MKYVQSAILILIIIGSLGYTGYKLLVGPCDRPKEYAIGSFDSKFGISQPEFLLAVQQAEKIWETALGRDLFVYSEGASLPINLVYDERQALAEKNKILEEKVGEIETSVDVVKKQFESLKNHYETSQKEYQSTAAAFQISQNAYNSKVSKWNMEGGASPDEYKKMEEERTELEGRRADLETKRMEVNSLADQINAQVKKYNYLVNVANSNIDEINESAEKEFEQGEFIRKDGAENIYIYEFRDRTELVRVLAHELGHSLDMDHNENENSIMYRLNSSENLVPTAEDVEELKLVCKLK